jgi:hypothetical protein
MVFGIGFSVASIGEQPDNLEAIRRAAAYQDCHSHVIATVLRWDGRRNTWRGAVGCLGVLRYDEQYGEPLLWPL